MIVDLGGFRSALPEGGRLAGLDVGTRTIGIDHVYDYNLFWANVRADVERRVAAFDARGPAAK